MSKYLKFLNDEYFKEINFVSYESKINNYETLSKRRQGIFETFRKKLRRKTI